MSNYQQYKEVSKLIIREIFGVISNEEKEKLQEWKARRKENTILYHKIYNITRFKAREEKISHFDSNAAWETISQLIHKDRKRTIRLTILKYAAIFILPLLIGGILYQVYTTNQQVPEYIVSSIEPGTQKAELILHGGKTINLENEENLSIHEKGGIVIHKKKAMLDYQDVGENENIDILYNTVRTPKGGEYNLRLSDGTVVYINSMSELKFPVQFKGNTREVKLTGEAYFEVTENKEIPFIVTTGNSKLEVLGTAFNMKAYKEERKVVTTLVKGKVKMVGAGVGEVVLEPGYQSVLDLENKRFNVEEVDVRLYTGWKDGKFLFYDERLEDIMITLARWYDAEVFYMNPSVKDLKFGGSLNKYEEINSILDIIALTDKVHVEIKNKTIVFYEK